ncbi:HEAT repeat domain-containing protein [Pseudomonas mendocina]|uniref:HEAT repeat domain-containing protein n=1 Tax=Ectopseudomonas mendocina TaxID=300 RepID=UPI0023DADC0C|nr:HEAT repeat domain-containing protein [Pseudomonas mendocina]MDF2074568.1 HEAT repeat domain-containing protein [Pseudomonas mendocina]
MIDDKDLSESKLRFILWEALRGYTDDELFELLPDDDVILRTMAAKVLQLRPSDHVFMRALDLCSGEDDGLREIGAYILGQLGLPALPYADQSIPVLKRLLRDDEADVRAAAVAAIGHIGSSVPGGLREPDVIRLVISLADDPVAMVRTCCAYALSSLASTSDVLLAIEKLRNDQDLDVREWADFSSEQMQSDGS